MSSPRGSDGFSRIESPALGVAQWLAGQVVVSIGCLVAILAVPGCSDRRSNSSAFTLAGKWRSEQRDFSRLIEQFKAANPTVPAQLMEPIFAKMKKGAQITDDWQFNPDGTGSYCLTREKPFSIRWKIVRKSGATWFLELNMNPEDKSPVKIVFKGPDRFAMIWLDEGESEEIPPGTYHRIR